MKQKDIALIIIIAAVSGTLSFVVSNYIFTVPANRQQTVAVVDPITTNFTTPDPKYFNAQSIDPAKSIELGNGTNDNPFKGSGH